MPDPHGIAGVSRRRKRTKGHEDLDAFSFVFLDAFVVIERASEATLAKPAFLFYTDRKSASEEEPMTRDEYVEKMKKQLDDWNGRLAHWEGEMQKAQAGLKVQFQSQLQYFQKQRDEMAKRMTDVQYSSQSAWGEMSRGLEEAWKTMSSSFERAWSEFHRKKDPGE
jgi:hypothetical protein